jgi:hypothetical protein
VELRKPQAKRTAVMRLERDKLVAELPIQVCSSSAGEVICPRDKLVTQMKHSDITVPALLEKGLLEIHETLEDYPDSARLSFFSITVQYPPCTPSVKRITAAMRLKSALEQCDFSVRIEGSDTMVKHEVAAAA